MLILAAVVLTAAAWLRGAEYDEQYTLFLTAGTPRPDWPQVAFPAGTISAMQSGHATLSGIARDLRATDVHPPLYFWAISLWRDVFGPGLLAARMLSVLCGLVSLHLVGTIARRCAIPPAVAMLLTLGCYGFVYTNAIARGFAPAQMLTLCGVALLFARRPLLAGACFGAACCCNYLAVFVSAAVIIAAGAWTAILASIPFLAVDAWFFAAQHASRSGQFPSFALWPSLLRLAEYQTAAVFGGLPLYFDGTGRIAAGAIIGLMATGLVLGVAQTQPLSHGPAIRMILAAAIAPPIGLLLLGAVFDNTPIELRYFSFGLPFVALLVASSRPRPMAAWARAVATVLAARTTRILQRRTTEGLGEAPAHRTRIVPVSAGERTSLDTTSTATQSISYQEPLPLTIAISLWLGVSGPPPQTRAAIGGPDTPSHDDVESRRHRRLVSQRLDRSPGRATHDFSFLCGPPWFSMSSVINTCERTQNHRPASPRSGALLLSLILTIQSASITGLLLSPRTMQPARTTAAGAARLTGEGIVLLPQGNDGVGIVGAFGIEAPPSLPILLICPTDPIAARLAPYHRVALAALAQDRDSTAAIAALHAVLVLPNWRRVAIGSNLEIYERTDRGE